MNWLKTTGMAAAGVLALGMGASAYGRARWSLQTSRLLGRLEAARGATRFPAYRVDDLDGLPAPVQRYFRAVLVDGQPAIGAVNMRHEGTFNTGDRAENWKPFTSRQRVVIHRPGFVWDAKIMMAPGLPVRVHDAYIDGRGFLAAALAGAYPVADMKPSPALDEGKLMRFLAEATWYPTALLPGQGVRWDAVDAHSARATLADGKTSASLLFRFNGDGLIDTVTADARGRTVGRDVVMTPWQGRWSGYAWRHRMLLPMEGEAAWLTPGKRLPYWRGRVLALDVEQAPHAAAGSAAATGAAPAR